MNIEEMYVPTGLKTVDGKDIMGFNGAFYLQNKEKINKMLKKYADIIIEEGEEEKQRENKYILKENTEKYSINKKHDKMFKEILSDKKETVEFINSFLHLNLIEDDIEKYEKEFRTSEFNNIEADIVYKIKNKNAFILIEHQSSVDIKMPYRILRYKCAIIESAIDKKRFKEQGYKIPTVIPIVLYTGKRKWKKLSINDIEETIEGYQENWLEYTLIDANKFSKEKLLEDNLIISKAMLIEKSKNKEELYKNIMNEFIEKIRNMEGRDEIMTNASRIINREIRKQRKAGLEQGLEQGFKQGIIQIAKKLKREMSIKDISRITGLTEQEIENL